MGGGDLGELTAREREVVLAAADGADTRVIAGRLFLSPRTVEHHLSAAYRKLGVSNRAALVALLRESALEEAPVTRYALSGDTHIAYQVVGDGPRDLILIPGFVSNVETAWTWPSHARYLRRLATGRRLIVFDKRGTGLSDPVTDPSSLTLEQRADDVRAVMDAAGSHRAALLGISEGVAYSMLFAAKYPSRTNGLILYGGLISPALHSAVTGVFADPAGAWEIMRQVWGNGQFLSPFAPTAAGNESERIHVARFERHGASPAAAYVIMRMAAAIEVRGLCPAVRAPSLVLHRRDDTLVPPAQSLYLAEHLPDARYIELEGADHPPWVGDNERFFAEAEHFLGCDHPALSGPVRLLQVLVATGRALGVPLLGTLERFGGRPAISSTGIIYTFDGAVRAVECALALIDQQPDLRLTVHVGELEIKADGISGPAVDIAAAAARGSPVGQVTVTGVVKHLTLGSGLNLTDGPVVRLPGGEHVPLFLAARPSGSAGLTSPTQNG